MHSETDYYTVLHLKPGSSTDEIRRQYRRLAKVYHPDRNPGEEDWCAEQLTQVNKAYEYLSNPQRKAAYDKNLGQRTADEQASPRQASTTTPSRPTSVARTQPPPSPNSVSKVRVQDQGRAVRPTPKQIAVMVLGGGGVGLVGALLSMGLFAYLHPPQSRHTVLPTANLYEKSTKNTESASRREAIRHHAQYPHLGGASRSHSRSHGPTTIHQEAAKLTKLGIRVPSNEFSKQELHEIAVRLQNYDKSH